MNVININGAHIAYRHRKGLGCTLVFANSLGSDQSLWDDVIDALPTGYGVLTYDLRGHGLSGGLTDSIEGLAEDVSALLDALSLTDVVFCGVSIGGMIGQVLAANRPDVVRAAILCNTDSQIGTAARWQDRISAIEEKGVAGIADSIVDNWFGPDYQAQSERLALHRNMVARTPDSAYIAACHAISRADLHSAATSITVPVHCVGGSHDKSVPAQNVQELAARISGASVTILDGVGHLPSLEAPTALAELIESVAIEHEARDGMSVRETVLGKAHVARANASTTALDEAFQALITEAAWGRVWGSPGIAARERSMLTLALLAATGNFDEIPMHVRACARTGASERDMAEAFQHVAIYAGVPRANHALKLTKRVLAEDGADNCE